MRNESRLWAGTKSMEAKVYYRGRVRERKKDYSPRELLEKSAGILAKVEALPEFRQARTVAAYWSLPDEVHTHNFIEKWCGRKRILLPVMCGDTELELREYRPGCAMTEAAFRIREPEGAVFPPEEVDLFLVPGMAFDRRNHRLGRGKGYYDRLLAGTAGMKVGLCFDFQFFDEIPSGPHDVPMDRVIY